MKVSKCRLLARMLALQTRNSELEDLHAGIFPNSKTGDYSDVKVVSPYGEIPWNKLGRISDEEMRKLMLNVEKNLFGHLWWLHEKNAVRFTINPKYIKGFEEHFFGKTGISWDMPDSFIKKIHKHNKLV